MNSLVLGKYASQKVMQEIMDVAQENVDSTTIVIVKNDDNPSDKNLVIHQQSMMGDVCDLLWEASKLDQNEPLLIASSNGYLVDGHNPLLYCDVEIFCSETSLAGFKFDKNKTVVESGDLNGNQAYKIYFKRTSDFVASAEKIIMEGKITDGRYSIKTVINQMILWNESISVMPLTKME